MVAGAYVCQVGIWAYEGVRRRYLPTPALEALPPIEEENLEQALYDARAERLEIELESARRALSAQTARDQSASERASLAATRAAVDSAHRERTHAGALRTARNRVVRLEAQLAATRRAPPEPEPEPEPERVAEEPEDPNATLDRFSMLEIDS